VTDLGAELSDALSEAVRTRDEGMTTAVDAAVALQRGANYPKRSIAWIEDVEPATASSLSHALNAYAGDGRFAPAQSLA
jgi:hypothetical protein